jgi:hypothetical protein
MSLPRSLNCQMAVLVLAAASPISAASAEALRWKFTAGEQVGYTIEQKADVSINANGAEFSIPTQQTLDVTWTVKSVADDGAAAVALHVDRVRLSFTAPTGGGTPLKFAYDSREGKDPEGLGAAQLKPLLKALAGADFTLTIAANGRISDVMVPENLSQAAASVPRGVAFAGGSLLTADGLRQTIENSVLTLPAGEIENGGAWPRKLERALPGAGALVFDLTHTLEGADTLCDRETRRIATTAQVTHQPPAEANEQVKLETVEGDASGTAQFDAAAGRTVHSVLKVHLLIDGIFNTNEFTQETDLTITVTLAGCVPPAVEQKPTEEKPSP